MTEEMIGAWLNNNQGIVTVMLSFASLLIAFAGWIHRTIFIKRKKDNARAHRIGTGNNTLNTGIDITVSGNNFGKQNNITNNIYASLGVKRDNQIEERPEKEGGMPGGSIIIGNAITEKIWNKKF